MKIETKNRGTHLDDLLIEDGILEVTTANAIKSVLAWQIAEQMKSRNLSKVKMAEAMNTSRAQLDRLLDPTSGNVTLATMQKAAHAVSKSLRVELV